MILVWGPSDDPPAERVAAILASRSCAVIRVDDAALSLLRYDIDLSGGPSGWIESGGRRIAVDDLTGIYLRPGPASVGVALTSSVTLLGLAGASRAVVVNPPSAGRSNWSKPFQTQLIAQAGFRVPDTLVTTDADAARSFLAEHGRIVYKSISGIRSIVATLEEKDADRLDGVVTGPVQFQEWIDGADVRVHVVGDRWFATAIDSDADDYRYGSAAGVGSEIAPLEIPARLGRRLVELANGMGLLVAGIDLRVTDDEWVCFEVNPSPGFTFYEDATAQPIGAAIADLLTSSQ